jgi:hypothetical protein
MSIDAGANPENLIIPSNPAINAISRTGTPSTSFPTASPFNPNARPQTSVSNKHSNSNDSDAPGTPGMMDIEMDEDEPGTHTTGAGTPGSNGPGNSMPSILPPSSVQWSAFQQAQQPPPGGFPQCVEPSKLSYAIPGVGNNGSGPPGSNPASKPGTPVVGGLNGVNLAFNGAGTGAIGKPPRLGGSTVLTAEQKAERAARKAARKEARRIAKENGELSSDDGRDAEGFKKYRCPVPGCNKSYRQVSAGAVYGRLRSRLMTLLQSGKRIEIPRTKIDQLYTRTPRQRSTTAASQSSGYQGARTQIIGVTSQKKTCRRLLPGATLHLYYCIPI